MVVNGYHFGICNTKKANYKKMTPYSKTILALIYLTNRPNVERKEVNCFIHGEDKYSQYSSFIWKNILADKLVEKKRSGNTFIYNITEKGKNFLNEFLKDFYKEHHFLEKI